MKKLLLVVLFSLATALYSYPSNIKITKSEGNYIRSNLTYLFGKNKICHNIGRNHINFPEIYDGNRSDLTAALLRLIQKSHPNFYDRDVSSEEMVARWYSDNCVGYREDGARKVKALEYFYNYISETAYY